MKERKIFFKFLISIFVILCFNVIFSKKIFAKRVKIITGTSTEYTINVGEEIIVDVEDSERKQLATKTLKSTVSQGADLVDVQYYTLTSEKIMRRKKWNRIYNIYINWIY